MYIAIQCRFWAQKWKIEVQKSGVWEEWTGTSIAHYITSLLVKQILLEAVLRFFGVLKSVPVGTVAGLSRRRMLLYRSSSTHVTEVLHRTGIRT